nr:alginate O-acetyltransferase complex protein AlgI [Candidatus Cloacimonadota bacterium]
MITLEYFGILVASLALYWCFQNSRLRVLSLSLCSLLFIWLLEPMSVVVVIGLSLYTYAFGWLIHRHPNESVFHGVGVLGILLVLILFKYLGMLSGISEAVYLFLEELPNFSLHQLFLPLGISYLTFKHISYLTDIKWRMISPGRFDDFILYSSFFTIFLAGPIERYERFSPQLRNVAKMDIKDWQEGSRRIAVGIFKKLVISNWLAYFLTPVWENPNSYSSLQALAALFAYAFMIYFDFSAYSDIAIGSSRLFGIRIMENFDRPYLAGNISQFWRKWHISLSDWIRDYLFFPLSRLNRRKFWSIFLVPVISMALCGLWHDADSRYLLWGIWHGLGLSAFQVYLQIKRKARPQAKKRLNYFMNRFGMPLTIFFVFFGWLSFRAYGFRLAVRIFMDPWALILIPFTFILLVFLQDLFRKFSDILSKIHWRFEYTVYTLILVLISHCAVYTGFIYAGF